MKRYLILTTLSSVACMFAAPVMAECLSEGSHDVAISNMHMHGLERKAVMFSESETVVELYASDVTGQWGLFRVLPDDTSCLMDHGMNFEMNLPGSLH